MGIALGSVTLSCVNDGTNGRGIQSTVVEYCAGYSPTTPPGRILVDGSNIPYANTVNGIPFSDGLWTTTIPPVPAGWYLWTRTKITYDDGTTSEAYNVGKEGTTIALEERQYYLSDSYVTLHGGSWSTAQPYPIPEGYYLWGRMKFTMTDGTVKYSSAVYENTLSGVINKTSELDGYIQQKIWQTDISSAIDDYDTLEGNVTIRDRISEYYQDLEGIHTTIGDTITSDDSIISNLSKTTQTANKINWLVSSGTSAANMQLTQDALTVIADNIDLTGKVHFNSLDTAAQNRITSLEGDMSKVNVVNISVTYGTSSSASTQPSSWSANVPTWSEGVYIWQRTVYTYKNGTTSQKIVCLTGHKGATGAQGPTGATGPAGADGIGIQSSTVQYAVGISTTDVPGAFLLNGNSGDVLRNGENGPRLYNGVWSNTIPTIPPGYYLWTKTEIKFTNGETNVAYSVSKEGTGISSVVTYYQMASSKPSKNAIEDLINWKTTPNDFVTGQHYYTCVVTTYLDGHKTCSAVIEDKALTSVANAATSSHKILEQWTHDALLADTTIDGGYIKTHTIEAKNLAVNAIMSYGTRSGSDTYSGGYSRNANNVYSTRGSYLDLEYGNIYTPSFAVINTVPAGESIAAGAYFNGNIVAKTLQLGTNVKFEHGTIGDDTAGFSLSDNGTLACSNASVAGNIVAKTGSIGGWTIGDKILWYGSQSPASGSIILTPEGKGANVDVGGSGTTEQQTWLLTAGTAFGVTKQGKIYSTSGKIGGFTIGTDKLYNNTSSIDANTAGVYLGTNGFANYKDSNTFVRISEGVITAKGASIQTGTIGGLTLVNGAIYYLTSSMTSTTAGWYLGQTGFVNYKDANTSVKIQNGVVTAKGANITGELHAGANSSIGPWNITATSIYKGNATYGAQGDGNMYFGNSGLSISNAFKVSSAGALTATSATISGTITAGADSKIGPWTVTSTAIKTGNYNTSGTMYFGSDSGLSIGTAFVVNSSGKLTATGADLASATIGSGNTKINISGGATPSIYYNISSMSSGNTSGFYLGSDGIRIGKVYVDSSGNTNLQTGAKIGSNTNKFEINVGSTTSQSAMYYGKNSLGANATGIYLGTDGIALGAKTSGMAHSPFEVGSDGILYATGAVIKGAITATSLSLEGDNTKVPAAKVSGLASVATSGTYSSLTGTPDLTVYITKTGEISRGTPTDGSTGFKLSSAGLLQAANAVIYGELHAGANSSIGPWNITTTSIYKGSNSFYTSGTMYFGNSGLSVSDKFKVDSDGSLNAISASISGTLTSGDGSSIGSWSVTNGILQNSDASIQLAPSAIESLDIIYPGGISRPTYIKAGEGGATRIGQGAIKTEYCLADAYGIQGKNAIRTSDVTGNIMFGNAPLIVIDKTNKDILIDAIDGENIARNNALRYNLVANGVRGFNVTSNTDFTLLENRLYLVIFFHASTSSYCGMYLIRGGQTQKYAISTASSITITYPDADHKTTFRWTSSSNPICRIEMLQ